MTKETTKQSIHEGLDNLIQLIKNLQVTGSHFIRLDSSQGSITDYTWNIENKSCIRKNKLVK